MLPIKFVEYYTAWSSTTIQSKLGESKSNVYFQFYRSMSTALQYIPTAEVSVLFPQGCLAINIGARYTPITPTGFCVVNLPVHNQQGKFQEFKYAKGEAKADWLWLAVLVYGCMHAHTHT